MAYPVSLVSMMQTVRQRTNLEGATAFITDQELTGYINGSLAEWYDEVRGTTWGGQYFRSIYPFQTIPTQAYQGAQNPPVGSYYPLPPDFVSLTSCDVFITPNQVISCRAFQEEQRNMFRWYPVGWLFDTPIFYQLWAGNIVFVPAPQSTFSVQINYVPTSPQLFNPSDTFDSINGWEEYVILDAAIKCLLKTGRMDMIQVFDARKAEQKERIRAMAPRRDMQTAEVVHEIATDDADWM
jgi:hypothetical protein